MSWFPDAASVRVWGGPPFPFPFTERSFLEESRWQSLDSFVLLSDSGAMIGFGQTYPKLGRGHIARLIVSPAHRGRGYGRALLLALMNEAKALFGCTEHSLYVLKSNSVAIRCYEHAGFRIAPYPHADDYEDVQHFMVRRT